VGFHVSSIKVTTNVANSGTSIKVQNVAVASGVQSSAIKVAFGTTTPILVVITAHDGITTNTHMLFVIRPAPPDIVCTTGARGVSECRSAARP